jgi:hypothetical protein
MTGKKPPFKVTFEEGCFDNLEDNLTEEEMEKLIRGIFELAETGEIFDNSTPVDELDDDERAEIYERLSKPKNTRH